MRSPQWEIHLGLPRPKYNTPHWSLLNLIRFSCAHFSSLSRSLQMPSLPSAVPSADCWGCTQSHCLWDQWKSVGPDWTVPLITIFTGESLRKKCEILNFSCTRGIRAATWIPCLVNDTYGSSLRMGKEPASTVLQCYIVSSCWIPPFPLLFVRKSFLIPCLFL